MFLYRKAADRNYQPEELTPDEKNGAELHIAKHRNGPTGMVKLYWDAARASFKNLDTRYQAPSGGGGGGQAPSTPFGSPSPAASAPPAGHNPDNVGLPPGVPPKGFQPRPA
jgi:hypothetical protein